jgi:hypothetical protein
MQMTTRLERRTAMVANGYDELIPLIGKRPCYENWSQRPGTTAADLSTWETEFPRATNTGLLAAKFPGLDIDITDPAIAQAMVDTVTDWVDGSNSVIMVRYGNAPKCLIPFHTDTPFAKMRRVFRDPSGKEQKLEFLGAGQQYVVDGTHPDIRKPYAWAADRSPINTPRSSLPGINAEDARKLFDHCCDRLIEEFGYTEITSPSNDHTEDGEKYDPIKALRTMHPSSAGAAETQCSAIMSLVNRAHHPDEIQDIVVTETMKVADAAGLGWTRDVEEKAVAPRLFWAIKTLCGRHNPEEHGDIPAWLNADFHEAWLRVHERGARPQLTRNPSGWYVRAVPYQYSKDDSANGAADNPSAKATTSASAKSNTGEQAKSTGSKRRKSYQPPNLGDVTLEWWTPINETALPPREWIYGKHYQRGVISGTIAPGGSGKTSLCMVEAIAMATGRNLLGEQPVERVRVWYHNAEDTQDEVNRRVVAICKHFKIPQQELAGWFIATSCEKFDLRVAKGIHELKVEERTVDAIADKIHALEIDVAVVDPLVNVHEVTEDHNTKMAAVAGLFRGIAQGESCSIEFTQHTRKMPAGINGDYVGADARGASAWRDALRSQRVINIMAKDEAARNTIPEHERSLYFHVDVGKANNARPREPAWRRIVSVELANGDNIGVVEPWNTPGTAAENPEIAARQKACEELFLVFLDQFVLRGQIVNDKSRSDCYAPRLFAEQDEAKQARFSAADFKAAMGRLLKDRRIKFEDATSRSDRERRKICRA